MMFSSDKQMIRLLSKEYPFQERMYEHITPKVRKIVVEWIYEVVAACCIPVDIAIRSVYIMDLYLFEYPGTKKNDVQAIACLAMHIAESDMFRGTRREIQLSLDQLAYLTDGAYTTKQLEDVEQRVSEMIESDRNEERINVLHFINLYRRQKMLNIEIELTVLAYLKCILMHRITNYQLPSKIVAACIYLARSGSDYENIWNEQLEKLSSYRKEDIEDTVQIVDALAMKNIESTTTDTDLCFNQIYLSCNNNKKRVRV